MLTIARGLQRRLFVSKIAEGRRAGSRSIHNMQCELLNDGLLDFFSVWLLRSNRCTAHGEARLVLVVQGLQSGGARAAVDFDGARGWELWTATLGDFGDKDLGAESQLPATLQYLQFGQYLQWQCTWRPLLSRFPAAKETCQASESRRIER